MAEQAEVRGLPERRPASPLRRLDRWLSGVPYWLVALLAWCLVAIKAFPLLVEPPVSALMTFPAPEARLTGTSYGLRIAAWVLRTESPTVYVAVAVTLTLVTMVVISVAVHRGVPSATARLAVLVLATGSIGTVLIGNIGRNDVFVILGASLLGLLGARWIWALTGTALMSLGNPEQAALAVLVYLMCCAAPVLRHRVRPAYAALALAVVVVIGISGWAAVEGASSRMGYLGEYLGNSLYHFGRDWPLSLYAVYGVLWLVIGFAVARVSGWPRISMALALILLPLLATATTLDQTRVFVGVSAAATFAVVHDFGSGLADALRKAGIPVLGAVFVACLLLPSIEIDYHGTVRPTYEWVFQLLVD